MSSLTEISVVDCVKNNMVVAKAELKIEPTFMNLGPVHFAVGINSSIFYYKWRPDLGNPKQLNNKIIQVCERDYFGTIKQVVMNDTWTAVLSDGKVSLHMIEDQTSNDIRFPQAQGDPSIIYIALAE